MEPKKQPNMISHILLLFDKHFHTIDTYLPQHVGVCD